MATSFTEEELKQIGDTLQQMGIKPKADTPGDFKNWMRDFVAAEGEEQTGNETSARLKTGSSHFPKISTFSGVQHASKGETTYDLWKNGVKCLLQDGAYSKPVLSEAMRQSLRGEAGRVVMRLRPRADIREILDKLDSIYGVVERKESLLAKFYSARQDDDEDVSTWGCRLEDILAKALDRGQVQLSQMNEMLRSMFWTGLKKSMKDVSGHKFDTITDFDLLRVSLRQIEFEQNLRKPKFALKKAVASSKMAAAEVDIDPGVKELRGMVHRLTNEVEALKKQQCKSAEASPHPASFRPQPRHSDGTFQQLAPTSNWQTDQSRWQSNSRRDYGGRGRGRGQGRGFLTSQNSPNTEPVCYRCRQPGHIEKGCRMYIYGEKALNFNKPMGRGSL